MMTKTLSILMAVKNGAAFLSQTLDALFLQSESSFEVIAVDDGSTDQSCKILSKYPIQLHTFSNCQGLAKARNKALSLSQGEFVTFLDQDDVPVDGSLSGRLAFLKSHPEHNSVVGEISDVINDQDQCLGDFYELSGKTRPKDQILWEAVRGGTAIPGALWLYMFRREFLEKSGPFDATWEALCDQEFLYRIIQHTPIPHVAVPVARYRIHNNNNTVRWEKGAIGVQLKTKALGVLLAMKYKIVDSK